MFGILHKRNKDWIVTPGPNDQDGKPQVICRRGGDKYCFRRSRRQERLVWLCWRRRRILFASILKPVGRSEGCEIVERASELLWLLEPSAEIYFDDE